MHINELRYWICEQLELKPFEWNEKTVVWTDGYYHIVVNDLKDPSFITVWTEDNKKIGSLAADPHRLMKEPWKKVRDVAVHPKHGRQRLGLRMYQILMQLMPAEYAGLAGYEPDIITRRVIQIYKRLGAENVGDYWFVRNPNRA